MHEFNPVQATVAGEEITTWKVRPQEIIGWLRGHGVTGALHGHTSALLLLAKDGEKARWCTPNTNGPSMCYCMWYDVEERVYVVEEKRTTPEEPSVDRWMESNSKAKYTVGLAAGQADGRLCRDNENLKERMEARCHMMIAVVNQDVNRSNVHTSYAEGYADGFHSIMSGVIM